MQIVEYVRFNTLLTQWLRHNYGYPVRFPRRSVENMVIRRYLQRQPTPVPRKAAEGETPVCLPDSKAKPVGYWNYLGPVGRAELVRTAEETMLRQLWQMFYSYQKQGRTLQEAAYLWCAANGISEDHDRAAVMRYQRLRDEYLRAGVDLRQRTRNRTETW